VNILVSDVNILDTNVNILVIICLIQHRYILDKDVNILDSEMVDDNIDLLVSTV